MSLFKKKQTLKKTDPLLEDQEEEKSNHQVSQLSTQSKNISKPKMKGISVKDLKYEMKKETLKGQLLAPAISLDDQSGLITIQYTKSANQERSESLLDKYLQEKIQKHFHGEENYHQDQPQQMDENEVILQEIQDIQKKYLSREDQDQAVWVGGIMEVNLSLEEKAQKLAQMEEVKRSEYFQSLITGQCYKKKIQLPTRRQQQDEEVQIDRKLKELCDRFYRRGRIHKHAQYLKSQENTKIEEMGRGGVENQE